MVYASLSPLRRAKPRSGRTSSGPFSLGRYGTDGAAMVTGAAPRSRRGALDGGNAALSHPVRDRVRREPASRLRAADLDDRRRLRARVPSAAAGGGADRRGGRGLGAVAARLAV